MQAFFIVESEEKMIFTTEEYIFFNMLFVFSTKNHNNTSSIA